MPVDKRGIFIISVQTEETDTPINSNMGCEISDKIENILVHGRLKEENNYFWKNELKPSLFVKNIFDNGYIKSITTTLVILGSRQQIQFKEFQVRVSSYFKTTSKLLHRKIRSKTLLLKSLESSRKQKAFTRFRSLSR